jgi:hypothetical protein
MFVGLDTPCPRHGGRLVSACIASALRPHVGVAGSPLAGLEVLPPLPRDQVPRFLADLRSKRNLAAAVLASEFETYSMAIHELAAVGLPLIASDIPAYDAVGPRAVARFRSGNGTDLAGAIRRVMGAHPRPREAVAALPPLAYGDALEVYRQVAARGRAAAAAAAGGSGGGPGGLLAPLQLQLVDAAVRHACEEAAAEWGPA